MKLKSNLRKHFLDNAWRSICVTGKRQSPPGAWVASQITTDRLRLGSMSNNSITFSLSLSNAAWCRGSLSSADIMAPWQDVYKPCPNRRLFMTGFILQLEKFWLLLAWQCEMVPCHQSKHDQSTLLGPSRLRSSVVSVLNSLIAISFSLRSTWLNNVWDLKVADSFAEALQVVHGIAIPPCDDNTLTISLSHSLSLSSSHLISA